MEPVETCVNVWSGTTPPGRGCTTANGTTSPAVPPILAGFGVAAKNAARLDAFAAQFDRLERKFDALLVGFGLDPAEYK